MRKLGLLVGLIALGWSSGVGAAPIEWVTVGDPGNAADTEIMTCCVGDGSSGDGTTGYGSVGSVYRISQHEVTNSQYAEFLNAVAETDTYGLYNTSMDGGVWGGSVFGGISRSGSSGSYAYSAIPGQENNPVNFVSYYDSLRFANWMHNGQPTGAQGIATTEDGAYAFSGMTIVGSRNPGATIFLASEDEWYKAAYYDAVSTSYFDYAAGSDVKTTCTTPGPTPNTGNCYGGAGVTLTDVGSYTGSPSPYGTFDQGGNVDEWVEAIGAIRGGGWGSLEFGAAARFSVDPGLEDHGRGFRVASVIPEPSTALLLGIGLSALAVRRKQR